MSDTLLAGTEPESAAKEQGSELLLHWQGHQYLIVQLDDYGFKTISAKLAQTYDPDATPINHAGQLVGGGNVFDIQFRTRGLTGDSVRCGFYDLPLREREAIVTAYRQLSSPVSDELQGLSYDELADGNTIKHSDTASKKTAQPQQTSSLKKIAATFMLIGSMLGVVVWVFYMIQSRSTVSVSNSVLVGNYQPISTPFAGQLTKVLVDSGDQVTAGQTLAMVTNDEVSQDLAEVRARLARARRELSAYEKEAVAKKAAFEFAQAKIDRDIVVAQSEMMVYQADLEAAQSQVSRLRPLVQQGNIGIFEFDEAKALLAKAKAGQARQQAEIESLRLAQEAAASSVLVGTTGAKNPVTEINTKIELAKAAIEEYLQVEAALIEQGRPTELVAPTSGTVYAVYRRAGEFLKVAEEAMAISVDEGSWATGHVAPYLATELKPGQPVEIEIPSLDIETKGTLQGIGHRSLHGRGGYTADFRGGPFEVPIRVSLDEITGNVPSGLRLNMTVRINDPLADLRGWVNRFLGRTEAETISDKRSIGIPAVQPTGS